MDFDFNDTENQADVTMILNDHDVLGDDPTKHRWRATWEREYNTTMPIGIRLTAYPVVSLTEYGAWIDPDGYFHRGEWEFYGLPVKHPRKRLVMNGSGSSWAKLTKDEALSSLAYRLKRWAQKTRREMNAVERAIAVADLLLPDYQRHIKEAKRYM